MQVVNNGRSPMSVAQRIAIGLSLAALLAAPLGAQTAAPAAAPAPASAAEAVPDSPIDLFYIARNQAPIWLSNDSGRAAAQAFAEVLRKAALDGLSDGPDLAGK